jgi:S-formylglutathione hydrolase FrmB
MPWHELEIESEALRGNPLGDPHVRPLWVWAPADRSRTYPVVYVLHAHMRSGPSWFNVEPFQASYPEEIEQRAPDAIVVLPDAWTALGGSQWIDSDGVGRYATYLRDEVVSFVEERFPANGLRALQGKSSGAYGALVNAFQRPDLFHAVAAHAPMALFEVTVAHDFPLVARALRERTENDIATLEVTALAAAFSGGELPFRADTAELVPEVWERWLAYDPLRIAKAHPDAAGSLRGIWLDAGRHDEYFLDLGIVALREALPAEKLHFELFDGGHRGVSGRYPLSLAWLVERLSITL